jgi:hypothetical protein
MDGKSITLEFGFDIALAKKYLADRVVIDQDRNQFMTVSPTSTLSAPMQTCKSVSRMK